MSQKPLMAAVFQTQLTWILILSCSVDSIYVPTSKTVGLADYASTPTPISPAVPEILNKPQQTERQLWKTGSSTRFTDVLNLHNMPRRHVDPPAANMSKMKWSNNLAHLAKLWSRHCIMEYGLPLTPTNLAYNGQILQNIWSGGWNGTIEGAILSWLDEGKDYNFQTGACYRINGCRNYLTMISSRVREVGCGLSQCNDDVIVVCYYGARIEPKTQSPYAVGQPCSQCRTDEWCDSGLCRFTGTKLKSGSNGLNCACGMEDVSDGKTSESVYSAPIDDPRLERQRRHATNSTSNTEGCPYDLTLWISVGVLVAVVCIGLLIGIISMLLHLCRANCATDGCCSTCASISFCTGRCKSGFCGRVSGSRNSCCRTGCRHTCFKRGQVKPEDEVTLSPSDGQSEQELLQEESDSLDVVLDPTPDPVCVDAEVQTTDVEYREICINTDPEPVRIHEDQSTCIEHDLFETKDASTSMDEECNDEMVDVEEEKETDSSSTKDINEDTGNQPNDKCTINNEAGHDDGDDDDDDDWADDTPSNDEKEYITPSNGVCLVKGCRTCPLHTKDMRKVEAAKREHVRKLIKARKDTNLLPGTYIL